MVYINSIEKNILPHYIQPENSELFSSWFCRLAIKHSVKPQSFILNYLEGGIPIFNRDIDSLKPDGIIEFLLNHTPLTLYQINMMFLESYNSYAFLNPNFGKSHTLNLLPIGIYHRDRKRFGMQYCPRCLEKKGYYKKQWRLVTSILCIECNEYLKDKCPKCSHPIVYHKIHSGNNLSQIETLYPINVCYNCKSSLTNSSNKKPNLLERTYQEYINMTIENGFNNHSQYSFLYIKALLYLSKRIMSPRKNNRFRECLLNIVSNDLQLFYDDIEYWSIDQRIEILPLVFEFLNNAKIYRNDFSHFKVSKSYLDSDKALPFWINNLLEL